MDRWMSGGRFACTAAAASADELIYGKILFSPTASLLMTLNAGFGAISSSSSVLLFASFPPPGIEC